MTIQDLADFCDVNWKTMQKIIKGESYKNVPFTFDDSFKVYKGRKISNSLTLAIIEDRGNGLTGKEIARRRRVSIQTVYRTLKRTT